MYQPLLIVREERTGLTDFPNRRVRLDVRYTMHT